MTFLPENMFSLEKTYTYYNWRKVFDQFCNIKLLCFDIINALKSNWFKENIINNISGQYIFDYSYGN